jgi:hypothetical protein
VVTSVANNALRETDSTSGTYTFHPYVALQVVTLYFSSSCGINMDHKKLNEQKKTKMANAIRGNPETQALHQRVALSLSMQPAVPSKPHLGQLRISRGADTHQ